MDTRSIMSKAFKIPPIKEIKLPIFLPCNPAIPPIIEIIILTIKANT